MIDESVRFLWPAGLALAILVVSIVCLVLSAIAVALRTYLRLTDNVFGIDDALIICGLVRTRFPGPRFIYMADLKPSLLHRIGPLYRRRHACLLWRHCWPGNSGCGAQHLLELRGQEVLDHVDADVHSRPSHYQELYLRNPLPQYVDIMHCIIVLLTNNHFSSSQLRATIKATG